MIGSRQVQLSAKSARHSNTRMFDSTDKHLLSRYVFSQSPPLIQSPESPPSMDLTIGLVFSFCVSLEDSQSAVLSSSKFSEIYIL